MQMAGLGYSEEQIELLDGSLERMQLPQQRVGVFQPHADRTGGVEKHAHMR